MSDKNKKQPNQTPKEIPNINEWINFDGERQRANNIEKGEKQTARIPTFETPTIPPEKPSDNDD